MNGRLLVIVKTMAETWRKCRVTSNYNIAFFEWKKGVQCSWKGGMGRGEGAGGDLSTNNSITFRQLLQFFSLFIHSGCIAANASLMWFTLWVWCACDASKHPIVEHLEESALNLNNLPWGEGYKNNLISSRRQAGEKCAWTTAGGAKKTGGMPYFWLAEITRWRGWARVIRIVYVDG